MNHDDPECSEDEAICDCAYHDNARRAEASHDEEDWKADNARRAEELRADGQQQP